MKRLLVIDSNVTRSSPSLRGWLASSRAFIREFDEVEVWAGDCELAGPNVRFRKTRDTSRAGPLAPLAFLWEVRARFRKLPARYLKETLIQSTGCLAPKADIRIIQFWNIAFMDAARERKDQITVGLAERFFRLVNIRTERGALQPGATGAWWCVSRGVADPIIRDDRNGARIGYLPNAYDDTRFNHATRLRWRGLMREHYKIADDEVVFCFSAYGHFERKGLRQAAEAVHILTGQGLKVRLMVIGGKPKAIESYKYKLAGRGLDVSRILFTGMVTEMEKHLSAADALLFPSHFEAFSLAEIEAAALGLRLYLTAHPGHEMILREGVNGRLLPWDVGGMARILAEEIRSGVVFTSHHETGEALTPGGYEDKLGELYAGAIARKWPSALKIT